MLGTVFQTALTVLARLRLARHVQNQSRITPIRRIYSSLIFCLDYCFIWISMRLCGALIFTDLTDKKKVDRSIAPQPTRITKIYLLLKHNFYFCCFVVLLFCCLVDCLVSYVIKSIKKTLKSRNNQS